MKRMAILTLGLVLLCSVAEAQLDPDDNSFGIYFDRDATVVEHQTVEMPENVTVYLAITNPTSTSIAGWACQANIEGDGLVFGWELFGAAINFAPYGTGAFDVSYSPSSAMVPVNNVIVVAVCTVGMIFPTDTASFSVGPYPEARFFPTTPGFVDGGPLGTHVPCGVSGGLPYGTSCAAINVTGIVENEEVTWGGVKALYR